MKSVICMPNMHNSSNSVPCQCTTQAGEFFCNNAEIRRDYISRLIKPTRQWKITQNAKDCTISGAVSNLANLTGEELHLIKKVTSEQDVTQLSKALSIQYVLERLYGKDYKCMKKRISYVVLTKKGEIITIKYFIYCKN